jgi:hypothetical protein
MISGRPPREVTVSSPSSSPSRPFDEVFAGVSHIQGWMTPAQARLLWDSASALAPGARVVEIGSYQGRSTVVLASSIPEGGEVHAIDPHGGTDRGPQEISGKEIEAEGDSLVFQQNLEQAGVRDRVVYHRQWSQVALAEFEGAVDLLYIDGAHRYAPARDDIRRWGDRVAEGGTMLIHDSFSSIGVTGALFTSLCFSPRWRYVGRAGSMTEYRREAVPSAQRLGNAWRQLSQIPYFLSNLVIKAMIVLKLRPLTRYLGYDPSRDWPH